MTTDKEFKYSFGGTKCDKLTNQDEFEDFYGDDRYYISNKVYENEVNDIKFEYTYVIEVLDMNEYESEPENRYIIALNLVPTYKSLTKSNQESVYASIGDSNFNADDITAIDIMSYGMSITMDSDVANTEDELQEKIKTAMTTKSAIDGLQGFYLDKNFNRIGNTGWDVLSTWLEDKDLVKIAIDRYNESKEG